MFRMSTFVLVVVVGLLMSGVYGGRYPRQSSDDFGTFNRPQNDVLNVGNGVNRHNVVVLDERTNSGRQQPDRNNGLGNRFGSDTPQSPPNPGPSRSNVPYQGTTVNNIGNGYENRNTVVSHRASGGGIDYYNVGYGPDNQNKVMYNGRPLTPSSSDSRGNTYHVQRENTAGEDCFGSRCDERNMYGRRVSSSARTNAAYISLIAAFLSFLQLAPF